MGACSHAGWRAHSALLGTIICEWARLGFSVFTALIQSLFLGQLLSGHNLIPPFLTRLFFFLMCPSALLLLASPDIF